VFNFSKKRREPDSGLPGPPEGLDFGWTCRCCGERFDTLPTDYHFEGPVGFLGMTEEERSRVTKTDDICVVSKDEMYVKGLLQIPILETDLTLNYGVWCSISEATLRYICDHEHQEYPEDDPPRFGWLYNWPDGYMPSDHIKCKLIFRNQNLRPLVMLEPTDYPLAVEQREGVSIQHVQQLAAKYLH